LSFVLAPTFAFARDHRDGHGYGGRGNYDRGYDSRHRHHDNDDAIIAGVGGLIIGAVIGSALSESRERRYEDRYYGPPSPPPRDGYYGDDGYYDQGYQGGYNGRCFRRELVWDSRLRRNVEVTHPIPC
jgi:hypothetical protein